MKIKTILMSLSLIAFSFSISANYPGEEEYESGRKYYFKYKNSALALEQFKIAAAKGHLLALGAVGDMHYYGIGIPIEMQGAWHYYQLALKKVNDYPGVYKMDMDTYIRYKIYSCSQHINGNTLPYNNDLTQRRFVRGNKFYFLHPELVDDLLFSEGTIKDSNLYVFND